MEAGWKQKKKRTMMQDPVTAEHAHITASTARGRQPTQTETTFFVFFCQNCLFFLSFTNDGVMQKHGGGHMEIHREEREAKDWGEGVRRGRGQRSGGHKHDVTCLLQREAGI